MIKKALAHDRRDLFGMRFRFLFRIQQYDAMALAVQVNDGRRNDQVDIRSRRRRKIIDRGID